MNSEPVREPGQRVVERLVMELLLEVGELRQRLLELAVLERDRRMARQRLEQVHLVEIEGADVAQPIGDHDRAHHPRLADQRRHHRVAISVGTGRLGVRRIGGVGAARGTVDREHQRPAVVDHLLQQRVVEVGADRVHRADLAARSHRRAQDLLAPPGRQEGDLGDLGPEHRADVAQQREQRAVHLGIALEDLRRLVEHLQAAVLLALGDVGAIGEEGGRDRDREQRDRVGPVRRDRHGQERQARVGRRDDDPGLHHLGHAPELRRALGERDRGRHRQHAHEVLDERRGDRRDPLGRAERVDRCRGPGCGGRRRRENPDQEVQDCERGDRAQHELRQVEGELHRSLTPGDQQREAGPDEAGREQAPRAQEEEPDDERDLAHRE